MVNIFCWKLFPKNSHECTPKKRILPKLLRKGLQVDVPPLPLFLLLFHQRNYDAPPSLAKKKNKNDHPLLLPFFLFPSIVFPLCHQIFCSFLCCFLLIFLFLNLIDIIFHCFFRFFAFYYYYYKFMITGGSPVFGGVFWHPKRKRQKEKSIQRKSKKTTVKTKDKKKREKEKRKKTKEKKKKTKEKEKYKNIVE